MMENRLFNVDVASPPSLTWENLPVTITSTIEVYSERLEKVLATATDT